jgi:hypothetical protein
MYVCVCVCMCICIRMYVCMYVCIHIYARTHTYTHTYICIYTNTQTEQVRLDLQEAHAEMASLKESMDAGPTAEMYVGLVKELRQLKEEMAKVQDDKSRLEIELVCVCVYVCMCVCMCFK